MAKQIGMRTPEFEAEQAIYEKELGIARADYRAKKLRKGQPVDEYKMDRAVNERKSVKEAKRKVFAVMFNFLNDYRKGNRQ